MFPWHEVLFGGVSVHCREAYLCVRWAIKTAFMIASMQQDPPDLAWHLFRQLCEIRASYANRQDDVRRGLAWRQRFCVGARLEIMPRISDAYTHNAVYLYQTIEDAQEGRGFGGSGFMVHVPVGAHKDRAQIFVVTNKHVVLGSQTPVIRLNRVDGTTGGFVTKQSDWIPHPSGDDVAVMPVTLDPKSTNFVSLEMARFVTQELVVSEDIGIGDDTFMVGRFIGHDGKQRNSPSVRFGNIAMMPGERIATIDGFEQESFLVEARSLPGYSGSAVHIYSPLALYDMSARRDGFDLKGLSDFNLFGPNAQADLDLMMKKMTPKGPYLLGIDWCHLNNTAWVLNGLHKQHPDGLFVRENTGMAGVIPAWKIAELLEMASSNVVGQQIAQPSGELE